MAKFSREKGKRGEQEVVNILKAAGFSAHRTGEYVKDDIIVAIDGQDRVVEVKMRARGFSSLYGFLKSSWAVIHKGDRQPWLITMPLIEFLLLADRHPRITLAQACDAQAKSEAA